MATKTKIIVLSDIHIGNNSVTNWYQAEVHEPYLQAALQYAIANKDSVQELIILGDLVDFWTYLPTTPPPHYLTSPPLCSTTPKFWRSENRNGYPLVTSFLTNRIKAKSPIVYDFEGKG